MVAQREKYMIGWLEVAGRRPGGGAKGRFTGAVKKDKKRVGLVCVVKPEGQNTPVQRRRRKSQLLSGYNNNNMQQRFGVTQATSFNEFQLPSHTTRCYCAQHAGPFTSKSRSWIRAPLSPRPYLKCSSSPVFTQAAYRSCGDPAATPMRPKNCG